MGKGSKSRNRKARITILTPEQIAERHAQQELEHLRRQEQERLANRRPENWGPREDHCPPDNVAKFARANEREARSRERVKISFQVLYEGGTIRIHHAVAGNRCLEICQRMTGQVEGPERRMEFVDGGIRGFEPVPDGMMTAQLEWKRLSSEIGTKPSNVLLRICMAWIEGVQIDWQHVVRTEFNLPKDENTSRDNRYLSAILVAALEAAHEHFRVPDLDEGKVVA